MIESKISKSFWPEAIATAVYLLNRLPTRILNFKTPLDIFSEQNTIPSSLNLEPRVFGCTVFVHVPKHERSKFSPCAIKCVFLGYGRNQKGYRCYDPTTRTMHTTMNCDFVEGEFFYSQPSGQGEIKLQDEELSNTPPSTSVGDPEVNSSDLRFLDSPSTNNDRENADEVEQYDVRVDVDNGQYELPKRSTRGVPPRRYSPDWKGSKSRYSMTNLAQGQLTEMAQAFQAALYEEEEIPQSFEEAMKHKHWRETMKKEIDALIKNGTWEKCTLPKGKKPVGCRWVFTIKRRADGSIERYKARLVAKGYTQVYGVDYSETFSPVAKLSTVRALLSVAACKEWPLHQLDVTNAFLHGELEKDKEVYMEVLPRCLEDFGEGQVCRLKKTLYGLKQSPRIWFGRFCQAMAKHGYKQNHSDHTLFIKKNDDKVTCLIIYVDDMIITGDDKEEIKNLKENLSKEFEMKDLGVLKYFLGIEVLRSEQGIFLRQRTYVLDLLAETDLLECKPFDIPMVPNHRLKIDEGAKLADREKYQRLVGKLIYLSHTRPDITYAVGVVSQFMHKPQEDHMEAAMRILQYLKGTT
ncbi:Beta-galactosidase 8 [Salvia divinorum]|uniref:Beta-galactosidase 8 n=1 Tax=Salvia divinorum TaxID=28513 RepID=A0ABD1GZ51_SALDI